MPLPFRTPTPAGETPPQVELDPVIFFDGERQSTTRRFERESSGSLPDDPPTLPVSNPVPYKNLRGK